MSFSAQGLLEITPDRRGTPTPIPVFGPAYDRTIRALEDDAFERAERAVLEAAGKDGDAVLYPHSFLRRAIDAAPTGASIFSQIAKSVLGLLGQVAGGARIADHPVTGRLMKVLSNPYSASRIAAITSRAIILAYPTRRDVALTRIALSDVRAVLRDKSSVVLKLAGEEILIEGLAQPKRFVMEARRCIARYEELPTSTSAPTAMRHEVDVAAAACEVAAIRHRLRERGWMLAVANDYRLQGEWHVFYSFAHPEGLSAKGEGTSDLAALRLAEADIRMKEARFGAPRERAL